MPSCYRSDRNLFSDRECAGDFTPENVARQATLIASRIQIAIEKNTGGLTCSVGIAPNRSLAKLCAEVRKPNGNFTLLPATRESVQNFVGMKQFFVSNSNHL